MVLLVLLYFCCSDLDKCFRGIVSTAAQGVTEQDSGEICLQ